MEIHQNSYISGSALGIFSQHLFTDKKAQKFRAPSALQHAAGDIARLHNISHTKKRVRFQLENRAAGEILGFQGCHKV